MSQISIHFVGGGRIYVNEDYPTVRERLRNHGVSRGYVEFSRDRNGRPEPVSVNVAQVTHFE